MTATSFYDINWNSTVENFTEDPASVCRRVEQQRIVSICFSFIAAIFLIYLVTALCMYSYKKKLVIGCRGKKLCREIKFKKRVQVRPIVKAFPK